MQEYFFHYFNFPFRKYFFGTSPAPDKFSNGLKLFLNGKITTLSQANMFPRHNIKHYKCTKLNFGKLEG